MSNCTASEEFLELTKSALLAALEGLSFYDFCTQVHIYGWKFNLAFLWLCTALGPGSLFGLATFSHKIGLYDVQGAIPVVKNVFIPPDSDGNLAMDLEDVMPLFSFLAPVCCLL